MFQNKKENADLSSPSGPKDSGLLRREQGACCIILAGGLGTRLRSAVPNLPKCMAPVAGHPFLYHVINYLRLQNVQHFVFSLGYKSQIIVDYLAKNFPTLIYSIVLEDEPLGTGGAIWLALQKTEAENVLIANGDTLFKVFVDKVFNVHQTAGSECTLSLKPMQNFNRYGVVELTEKGIISSFKEKQFYESGLINGGLYLLNRQAFLKRSFPQKFSFEKDYLEKFYTEGAFFGCAQDGYFIDIGIPEDYNRAQTDLQRSDLDFSKIDKSWSLFLDRDGVLNDELPGTYVLNKEQFAFSAGVLDAVKTLSDRFGRIIVITNQRGVGRGLMTEADLLNIHAHMQENIQKRGGRIDAIYYCTDVDSRSFYRKPNPGAALKAQLDWPEIDFSKSIMVGNTLSDMEFGRAAGMHTIFISSTIEAPPFPHKNIGLVFPSLAHFAAAVQS